MQRYKLSLAVVTLSLFVTLNNCLSTTESHERFCPLTGTEKLTCDGTPRQTVVVTSATYGQVCSCQGQPGNVNCGNCRSWNITEKARIFCQNKQVCSGSLSGSNTAFIGSIDCRGHTFLNVSYICKIVETTTTSRVKSTALPRNKASTSQHVTSSTTTKSVTRQTAVTAVSNALIDRQQTGTFIIAPKKWRDDGHCGQGYPAEDGTPAECDPSGIYPCCSPHNWCGNTAEHCDCGACVDYRNTVPGTGGIPTPSTVRPVQSTKRTTKATMITMFTVKTIALTTIKGRVPRRTLPSVPTDGGVGLRIITPGAPPGDNNLPVAIGAAVGGVVLLAAAIATVVIVMKRRRSPTPVPSSTPAPDVTAEPTYDSIREEEGGVQLGLSGATCSYSTIGQPNVTSESDRREAMYSKPDKNKAKTARNVEDLYAKPLKKESGEVENVLYESAGEFGVG